MSSLFTMDENLREVPVDPRAVEHKISELMDQSQDQDPLTRAKALGEMGAYLRILKRLDEAEAAIDEALLLVLKHGLGPRLEVQQHLRLAHVYQWQGRFNLSTRIFKEMTIYCMTEPAVQDMLHYVWQHSGKNLFDQKMFAEALRAFQKALDLRKKSGAAADLIESSELAVRRAEEMIRGPYIN